MKIISKTNNTISTNRYLYSLDIMFSSGGFFFNGNKGQLYVQWSNKIPSAYNESIIKPSADNFIRLDKNNICLDCGYPVGSHGFLIKEKSLICPNNYIVPIGNKIKVYTPIEFIDLKNKNKK